MDYMENLWNFCVWRYLRFSQANPQHLLCIAGGAGSSHWFYQLQTTNIYIFNMKNCMVSTWGTENRPVLKPLTRDSPEGEEGEAGTLLKPSLGLYRLWMQTRSVLLPLAVFELLSCWRIEGNITSCSSANFTKTRPEHFPLIWRVLVKLKSKL